MIQTEEYKNINRTMYFLASNSNNKSILTLNEVNLWLDNYSDTLFCNGQLRRVIFKKITPQRYEVYTEKIR